MKLAKSILSAIFLFFLLYIGNVSAKADNQIVLAGWYGSSFEGRAMKNGDCFKANDPTIAAHKTLPLGTTLLVKNPANGRKLVVIVKDRGPFVKGRDLDLSYAAAKKLGYVAQGVARLSITEIENQ